MYCFLKEQCKIIENPKGLYHVIKVKCNLNFNVQTLSSFKNVQKKELAALHIK